MKSTVQTRVHDSPASEAGRMRLLSTPGDPLVQVRWLRVLFLNFEVPPDLLRVPLPAPFALEEYDGSACVSLVALTMRRFRRHHHAPLWGTMFSLINEQRFFNLRTYVRVGAESGAFFLWSWLSRPWGLPLPARPFGLSCGFAKSFHRHSHETGDLRGEVIQGRDRFRYSVRINPATQFETSPRGSLSEFALERYTGFFWHHNAGNVFRAWHPPWLQIQVDPSIEEDSLVTRAFPWFKEARLIGANYAPGFDDVWIGRPHKLGRAEFRRRQRARSAFFDMP